MAVLNCIAAGIFIFKGCVIIFIQMWLRWTLPRPRIDQVLYACVKVLLPASCVLLLGASLWQLFVADAQGVPWQDYNPLSLASWVAAGSLGSFCTAVLLTLVGLGLFGMVSLWVLYAMATGRTAKGRLTEPEEIVVT